MTQVDIHEVVQDLTTLALAISVIVQVRIHTLTRRRIDTLQQMIMEWVRRSSNTKHDDHGPS
jgi:hypothetical protein